MAETMKLRVITPERTFYEGDVKMAEFDTANGQMGIYPAHIPLTVMAVPGVLTIHEKDGERKAALISGFIQILPEKVTILAEDCQWPEEIDEERAKRARERARERLEKREAQTDLVRAEAALKRAYARLSALNSED